MAASAGLAVTLVPVLMGYFIRGRIPAEDRNPLNVFLIWLYRPLLNAVMRLPRLTLLVALLAVLSLVIPIAGISGFLAPSNGHCRRPRRYRARRRPWRPGQRLSERSSARKRS